MAQKSNRAPAMDNRGARVVPIGGTEEPAPSLDIPQMFDTAQTATPSAQLTGMEALVLPVEPPPQGQATPQPPVEQPAKPEPAPEQPPTQAAQPAPQPDKQAPQQPPVDPLIERFRTMTPEQQAEAYANLERLRGKQGEELGLLRKLAERVVLGQVPVPGVQAPGPNGPQYPSQPKKIDLSNREELVTKLLTEPDAVIQAVTEHTMNTLQQRDAQSRLNAKLTEVKTRYESDPGFAQFIDSVPQWIKNAATTPEAIDNVIQAYAPATSAPAPQAPRPSAPAHLGVSSAPSAAAKPQTHGRIYTHAELADMMLRRPQEYAALQTDIWKAAEEGRVK